MRRSTKLHLIAVVVAAVGFSVFALPLWVIKDVPHGGILSLFGLALIFVGVLSGLGFGPLGRLRNRAAIDEDAAYRKSLEAKQPWQ